MLQRTNTPTLLSGSKLDRMRASCALAADCLIMVGEKIKSGMTTDDINTLVHEFTLAHGATPSPLNYQPTGAKTPFPKSVCTSVNEVVCHGIPGARKLVDGDIVNVDVTMYLDGFHGDTSATFYIGKPSERVVHVVETARHALERGLAEVKHDARIGDIGAAIQEYVESRGCSVVRDYVGHGVGESFHMAPQVPHYGKRGAGQRMKSGMVFTIEPMVNLGAAETEVMRDDWTVLTRDRSLSAQFEHSILVTASGCEVLTSRKSPLVASELHDGVILGPLGTAAAFAHKN